MPGFGFAYMNTEDVVRCQEISKMYLTRRGSSLKRVLLLLDARHGLKSGDEKFFRELFATTASSLSGDKKEVSPFKRFLSHFRASFQLRSMQVMSGHYSPVLSRPKILFYASV